MTEIASRLMRLFEGFPDAYGTYRGEKKSALKGGKLEIKDSAKTIREPVTEELWDAHLNGEKPLGIIPIGVDDMCHWGCIDVDRYDVNHAEIVADIEKRNLPLLVCRSKSGGAHVFIFFEDAIDAEEVQVRLREIAATLGFGGCEIFPKQTKVLVDRGDLGNWLNMPYFRGNSTDRYGVKITMGGMSVEEFLNAAESRRLSPLEFERLSSAPKYDDTLEGGPPCLQHLTESGFPEGTRNNGLFALGVFCRKKFGENWEDVLEKYNREFMDPPLSTEEVTAVIKSLKKKDYNYKCNDSPIVNHCNAAMCRTRKFGVGASEEYPNISGLSVLDSQPPIWFLTVDDKRVELKTEELADYRKFHKVCMEELHVCFGMLTQKTWTAQIGAVMKNAIKIEAPPEASIHGHFMELLYDFCVNRHKAQTKEEIPSGKPWTDDVTGRTYFRLRDLMVFLERERFVHYGRNKLASEIEKLGGRHFFVIKNMGVNVLYVKDVIEVMEPIELPPTQKDPI